MLALDWEGPREKPKRARGRFTTGAFRFDFIHVRRLFRKLSWGGWWCECGAWFVSAGICPRCGKTRPMRKMHGTLP